MNAARTRLVATVAAIPAVFALGGCIARTMLAHAPRVAQPDLAQPLAVVTGWGTFGTALWSVLAAVVFVTSLAGWSALRQLRAPAFGPRTTLAVLCLTALCAVAAALTWPVIFSSDVYAYAAYGDIAARGLDPSSPLSPGANGPLVAAAEWQWRGPLPVCVYGGAFVAIARAIVTATAGHSVAATLLAFRGAASVAFVLACVALYAALRRGRVRGVAVLALNPIAIWCAAEGHNDAIMVALAIAGVAMVRAWGPLAGGFALGLASAIKAPGLAAGAALAGVLATSSRAARTRVGVALVAAAVVASALALPRAAHAAHALGRHGVYAPQYSLQAVAIAAARYVVPHDATALGTALTLCALLALALVAASAIRAGNRGAWAWLAAAAWLAIPNPYPWYAFWILPVAAALADLPVLAALWGVTICVVLRYLPDAFGTLPLDQQLVVTLIELAPLVLFAGPLPRRAPVEAAAIQ